MVGAPSRASDQSKGQFVGESRILSGMSLSHWAPGARGTGVMVVVLT